MAAAKAAQHRLMRGVWTNVRFGDMRRALAGTPFLFHLVLINLVVYTRKVWCKSWIILPLADYTKSPHRYYLKQAFAPRFIDKATQLNLINIHTSEIHFSVSCSRCICIANM
jgi:hypothetical protein